MPVGLPVMLRPAKDWNSWMALEKESSEMRDPDWELRKAGLRYPNCERYICNKTASGKYGTDTINTNCT